MRRRHRRSCMHSRHFRALESLERSPQASERSSSKASLGAQHAHAAGERDCTSTTGPSTLAKEQRRGTQPCWEANTLAPGGVMTRRASSRQPPPRRARFCTISAGEQHARPEAAAHMRGERKRGNVGAWGERRRAHGAEEGCWPWRKGQGRAPRTWPWDESRSAGHASKSDEPTTR